jgi:hypothetical protein
LTVYILVPILAWLTKIALDTEPDVARHLAVVTIGRRRELIAGLAAAVTSAYAFLLPALVIPWLIGGIALRSRPPDPPVAVSIVLGVWALLVAPLPALALGALSSRVVTANQGRGAMALVGGWVVAVVAGLPQSPVRFLAPPLIEVAKAAHGQLNVLHMAELTAWTATWSAAALAVYITLRRSRT